MNYVEGLNGGLSQIEHYKKSPFYNVFCDIMESVMGKRCLIKPCSMNGAIASKCISVDTMLQNLCDFSPSWRKIPWGKVGLSIEKVCTLSVVIYKTKKAVIDLAAIAVTMTYTTVNMETFSPFMRQ